MAPGSIGEQVGFEAGDLILSLNETPMEEISVAQSEAIIRDQGPLGFAVDRQGDKVHIEID